MSWDEKADWSIPDPMAPGSEFPFVGGYEDFALNMSQETPHLITEAESRSLSAKKYWKMCQQGYRWHNLKTGRGVFANSDEIASLERNFRGLMFVRAVPPRYTTSQLREMGPQQHANLMARGYRPGVGAPHLYGLSSSAVRYYEPWHVDPFWSNMREPLAGHTNLGVSPTETKPLATEIMAQESLDSFSELLERSLEFAGELLKAAEDRCVLCHPELHPFGILCGPQEDPQHFRVTADSGLLPRENGRIVLPVFRVDDSDFFTVEALVLPDGWLIFALKDSEGDWFRHSTSPEDSTHMAYFIQYGKVESVPEASASV